MQHITGTDKNLVYVSIVASQRAQSHSCTLYFATFAPGGKFGNLRLISGLMVTQMRNGSVKAAEMKPFYILVREEKASRIPHRHSKAACYPGASNDHPAFSDTTESYFCPIFTNRDSSEKNLMSPLDKPTGEVTDAHVYNGLSWAGVSCAICGYDRDYGG